MLIAIIVLALVAAILLTVFLVRFFTLPRIYTNDGGATLTDAKNDITYYLAPDCYSADLDTSKAYCKIDGTEYYRIIYSDGNNKQQLYDPLKLIGTVDDYGEVTLYVAEGVALPTLSEFKTDKALVYYIRLIEYLSCAVDPEKSAQIEKLMLESEAVTKPLRTVEDSIRMVYLGSSEHPYITYTIKYYEDYADGRYLYDSASDKCIRLDADTLKDIFD